MTKRIPAYFTLRKIILMAALILSMSCPGAVFAQDNSAAEEFEIIQRYDARMKANKIFMTAAQKAIAANKNQDAESFLKKAQILFAEAEDHYKKQDWAFALEDLNESTRMALYAITLASTQDKSLHDAIIQEEFEMYEGQDHARKEAMITKGHIEAETFIMTADRLLAEKENSVARQKLGEARRLLKESRKSVAINDYDNALKLIDDAYLQATQSVKDIKKAQGDSITYPRTEFASDKDALAYEAKRNDTYIFFASQVMKDDDESTQKLLDDAQSLKAEATSARDAGNLTQAVQKFRESTQLLIKAIKEAVNR